MSPVYGLVVKPVLACGSLKYAYNFIIANVADRICFRYFKSWKSALFRIMSLALRLMLPSLISLKIELQAPPEQKQVFSSELQRVGNEGAKVLRTLGNKVKKMEKLSSGDILFEVHEAAEELQKKIVLKSYLLVNSESWEFGKHTEKVEDAKDLLSMMEDDNKRLGIKSLSEAVLDLRPVTLSETWDVRNSNTATKSSIPSSAYYPEKVYPKQKS